jgi:hypothetical protein
MGVRFRSAPLLGAVFLWLCAPGLLPWANLGSPLWEAFTARLSSLTKKRIGEGFFKWALQANRALYDTCENVIPGKQPRG